ncbi:MAG: hypothetical protein Q6370_022670, partial [Candidatus Sigynarchaeota archaeon]
MDHDVIKKKMEKLYGILRQIAEKVGEPAGAADLNVDENVSKFLASGYTEDDLDTVTDWVKIILPFVQAGVKMQSMKDLPADQMEALDKIPVKETVGPMFARALSQLGSNPEKLDAMLDSSLAVFKMIAPRKRRIAGILKLLSRPAATGTTRFDRDIASKFLEYLDLAETNDPARTKDLMKSVKERRAALISARSWWDSSNYQRLGLDKENLSWKQFIEAIFKKDDLLFGLPEPEITMCVIRLAKDFASAIEEHLKLVLAVVVNLKRIGTGEMPVPFDGELGSYVHELDLARTKKEMDLLDIRNINTHNIVKIVSIDKDKKDMQLEFSIKRYDK